MVGRQGRRRDIFFFIPIYRALFVRGTFIDMNDMFGCSNPRLSRSSGPTDKAPDYGSGDSRFESWLDREVFFFFDTLLTVHNPT